jgi:SecD/SecF fusion protein
MNERYRSAFVLALVVALVLVSVVVTAGIPGVVKARKTHLGLDLQGGVELIFQARPAGHTKVDSASISQAITVIRSRIDQLGVSEPQIVQSGSNEIDVSLPNVKSASQAQRVVGVTGQLYFYDWENSVIAANGKPAGPNGEAATGDPTASDPTSVPGTAGYLTEYQAVLRAAKQTPAYYALASAPDGTYYYVNDTTRTVLAGPEQAPTRSAAKAYLAADLAQQNKKLPAAARLVFVPPGTVLVQMTSAPEAPIINAFYVLRDDPFLTGSDINNPQATTDPTQGVVVSFGFNGNAANKFQNETLTLAQRGQDNSLQGGVPNNQHFAATLGGTAGTAAQIVTIPSIVFAQFSNGIPSGGGSEITGSFTYATATTLANVLASGALPLALEAISSRQVTATLGHQALNQGLTAGLVGLALVALFLLVFYRVLGVIAVSALAIYALYFYALIKLIPVTLTLPGIAGLILTIGVAADANVVIFERVKEESRAGRSPLNAITAGYKRGFSAIIDANVVTFMAAFILFILSQSDVQGFALTLGMGVLVSLFTAVAATRAMLSTMGRTRFITRPSALGAGKHGRQWTFDFMGKSRWLFTLSGTILLIGAIAIGARGVNFGIDFVSGTQIQATLVKPATVSDVTSTLNGLHIKAMGPPTVQQVSSTAKSKHRASFQISTKTLTTAEIDNGAAPGSVRYALAQRFGIYNNGFSDNSVGPSFGKTVADSAAVAIVAALLAIAAYIALRFQWKYAVPVMIALMHDLLITAGVYALTGRQVTADTVAALLTILGYSMYDTIIVFDRVRENVAKMQNAAFSQIVNRSMSEVLTRSLATSLCTLLPIMALLFFGGSTLKDFAFALLVGVASGAYSSIFIASPVLTHWKEREPVYRRRRARIAAEHGGLVPAYATTGAEAREVDPEAGARRRSRRLTEPPRPEVKAGEFRELVRELHTAPAKRPVVEAPPDLRVEPPRDPTADARPEDVVMPADDAAARRRGASKSRDRRRGRPR